MPYQLNKAHLLICIFAGLVLTGGFLWHIFFRLAFNLFTMALWVSVAIVLFYFAGRIARSILIDKIFVPVNDEYDFSQDEEYQAFIEGLEQKPEDPVGVMFDDPMAQEIPYDESLRDPFLEPMPLDGAQ